MTDSDFSHTGPRRQLSRARLPSAAFAGAIAIIAIPAALAFACIPAKPTLRLSGTSGPAGSQVEVTGSNFAAGTTAEIHWNSATGPLLATAAAGKSFTTSVTIPNAPADTHMIVAVGPDVQTAAAFTVTKDATSPGESARGGSPTSTPTPAGSRGPGATSLTTPGGNGPSARPNGNRVSDSGAAPTTPVDRADHAGGDGRTGRRAAGDAVGPQASASRASVSRSTSAEPPGGGKRSADRSDGTPSSRSAVGDLWSGFSTAGSRLGLEDTVDRAEGGSLPTLAMALIGLGLITALGGLGVAGARRRPTRASAGREE